MPFLPLHHGKHLCAGNILSVPVPLSDRKGEIIKTFNPLKESTQNDYLSVAYFHCPNQGTLIGDNGADPDPEPQPMN